MNLLHYEFQDNPEGSYNAMIGNLVKTVRHYRSNVPADEFKNATPHMKEIESALQRLDTSVGEPVRYYLQEIMQELDEEDAIEDNLMSSITIAGQAINNFFNEKIFRLEDYSYDYNNFQAVQWLEFYGYIEKDGDQAELRVIGEIFRSVCNQKNVIFINSSLAGQ
jgi:hypothetical protein